MCVQLLQWCLTFCHSMDCSPPGSFVHGILHASILEWVSIPFSKGSSQLRDWTRISCVSCIAGGFFTTEPPGKSLRNSVLIFKVVKVVMGKYKKSCLWNKDLIFSIKTTLNKLIINTCNSEHSEWDERSDCSEYCRTRESLTSHFLRVLCCVQLLQLCLTLCDAMDYSPPGSSVHGILRQEYWSGLLCSPPGDLPDPGIELISPASPSF